ncbi:YraN family protein [Flagellimonas nanhaiensis]|uniref:UPF0102 protein DX873_12355 n=1 Tax=Flagellimonas nanhaiensis TaxID=2292706 RepID=A0A371JRI6_9FLAO|nr:YraN family protein [Allomuricauda nanhaiensis]RDY60117.1 endonuclease [Allomuricauda nanhaiensis]
MGKHNEFGKRGEQIAADFLIDKGYNIRARNYRFQYAEVDIIAEKDGILSVVEVKSRTHGFLEDISETVNKKKIRLLTLAANEFVLENDLDLEVRFDILLVIQEKEKYTVEHMENAFYYF